MVGCMSHEFEARDSQSLQRRHHNVLQRSGDRVNARTDGARDLGAQAEFLTRAGDDVRAKYGPVEMRDLRVMAKSFVVPET